MREEGLLTTAQTPEEIEVEIGLRPKRLDEFVGQEALKERLSILIEAAATRGESVDHLLFSGPPGLGKTSLAAIVANEMGASFRSTSGPALDRPGDLAAVITNLEHGDVLFIDEIHRLPRQVEEVMYPAMEDGQLDIVVGKGPAARSIKIDLPAFTLVGADGCEAIARRSRGTPRIANRLLRRVRDYAAVRADGQVDAKTADTALEVFEVDEAGLDKVDRAILNAIITKFGGGPVGLSTLAIAVGEDTETVEDAYEPFLILEGMIQRTPRGRIATARAFKHLGVDPPHGDGQGQFLGS
jgi:Holliday junction DNA helicase RuvB